MRQPATQHHPQSTVCAMCNLTRRELLFVSLCPPSSGVRNSIWRLVCDLVVRPQGPGELVNGIYRVEAELATAGDPIASAPNGPVTFVVQPAS